jgi:hypothetical protein
LERFSEKEGLGTSPIYYGGCIKGCSKTYQSSRRHLSAFLSYEHSFANGRHRTFLAAIEEMNG